MFKIFIHKPIATTLLMIALFLTGVLGYKFLPIASLPEVDYPTIQVTTNYPGASPKVIESAITAPLERQFGQMPGLKQMLSTSSSSVSMITLKFDLNLKLDIAEQQVQQAINAADGFLPKDLPSPPIYNKVNPADSPIITLAVFSENIKFNELADIVDTKIVQKLSQISGVGMVKTLGASKPSMRILFNQEMIASLNLSTEYICEQIQKSNVNGSKGIFDGEYISYVIDSNDRLITKKDYEELIILSKNNSNIKLSDVAVVEESFENIRQSAFANNKQAIIITVQKQPGANIIQVADKVKDMLPSLMQSLKSGIEVEILTDKTLTIRESIKDVEFELILSIFFVVVSLYFFLKNISSTVIPSISVPLSLVGTFGIMYLLGYSINNLTLMALTIATGFVVDDAIVMVENIVRHIENGLNPLDASIKGLSEIGFTILSLTVSLIAVLIPLFFMEDIIGRIFKEFAVTLGITIGLSCIVSLVLIPMMSSRILKQDLHEETNYALLKFDCIFNACLNFYKNTLNAVLNNQTITLIGFMITLLLTFILFYFIPKGFFPTENTGALQLIFELKQDSSFEYALKKQSVIDQIIREDSNVVSYASFVGLDSNNQSLSSGKTLINLKHKNQLSCSLECVMLNLKNKLEKIPGVVIYIQPIQDISVDDKITKSKYQYTISSSEKNDVNHYSNLLINELKKSKHIKNITSDLQNGGLEIFINIQREKLASLNINIQDIDKALYTLFGQRQISTIFSEKNQYRVVTDFIKNKYSGISIFDNVYVRGIPLKTFANYKIQSSPNVIQKQNQFPAATISFDLNENSSLDRAIDVVIDAKNKINIPSYINTTFQGTALAFTNSSQNQIWLIIAAIVVVYIVLGVLYESYIHPITILSTLPSACIGALIALIVTKNDLNVISVIGIILLIGIVKKNAIMMIDFALDYEKETNSTALESITKACHLRFRPIIMTTLVALLAAIPLAFSHGAGAEIRIPLGITIIGGLTISQILTLYTTPVIYLFFDKLSKGGAKL